MIYVYEAKVCFHLGSVYYRNEEIHRVKDENNEELRNQTIQRLNTVLLK